MDYKSRMMNETIELVERADKLAAFIAKVDNGEISINDIDGKETGLGLLRAQHLIMKANIEVLNLRLNIND